MANFTTHLVKYRNVKTSTFGIRFSAFEKPTNNSGRTRKGVCPPQSHNFPKTSHCSPTVVRTLLLHRTKHSTQRNCLRTSKYSAVTDPT